MQHDLIIQACIEQHNSLNSNIINDILMAKVSETTGQLVEPIKRYYCAANFSRIHYCVVSQKPSGREVLCNLEGGKTYDRISGYFQQQREPLEGVPGQSPYTPGETKSTCVQCTKPVYCRWPSTPGRSRTRTAS